MRSCYLLIITSFFIVKPVFAECTVAVISGKATVDGRPLLWKNRDSSFRNNDLFHFNGERYDFVGVINSGDTTQVWMGVNTAGFCIMNSESMDQPGDSIDTEGFFMKKALSRCAQLKDFEELLDTTALNGRGTKANFGVIDAFGGAAFYETGNHDYSKMDANNPVQAPQGFLVRANFSMTGQGRSAYGSWRYHRALELFRQLVYKDRLSHQTLLKEISRDLFMFEGDPYPLPFEGSVNQGPQGFIYTQNTINRHRTVSCAVFHGVKPGEEVALTTMWTLLGEPVAGVAIPVWAKSGQVPDETLDSGPNGSSLNRRIQTIEQHLYSESEWPHYLDSNRLVKGKFSFIQKRDEIESDVFSTTHTQMVEWRLHGATIKEFREFQDMICDQVFRKSFY
jgi:hypothetical protein